MDDLLQTLLFKHCLRPFRRGAVIIRKGLRTTAFIIFPSQLDVLLDTIIFIGYFFMYNE